MASQSSLDLLALALVMEGRLKLDDAVRVLMVRADLDRARAAQAIVRAATFASDEYNGLPLERHAIATL
jgi:hypothetical protein